MPTMMARVAHTGGACFGLAGIATLMVLVVIQDLAFGWSTTLVTSNDGYYRFLKTLALPWHNLWPTAVPDSDLVAATRFFRATPESGTDNPERWGQWWPFVVMVWSFYVVLPRLAGLLLSQVQLGFRARRALSEHPGMRALEYRMETPTVDTGNQHHDSADTPDESTLSRCRPLPQSQILIRWAGAGEPELPDSLAAGHLLIANAGGQQSLAEDQKTIDQSAEILRKQDHPAAVLVTRGWEPPIGELADFIRHALDQWPAKTQLALVPMVGDASGPGQRQLDQWLRFAERLNHERVWVSQPFEVSPQARAYPSEPEGLT